MQYRHAYRAGPGRMATLALIGGLSDRGRYPREAAGDSCSSAGPAGGGGGGVDVLIEVEHVVWVEAGFEAGEPLELLRPVGVADADFALDAEVVDVDASAVGCYLVGVQAGAGASGVVFAG